MNGHRAACRVGRQEFHSWIANLPLVSLLFIDPYSLFKFLNFYLFLTYVSNVAVDTTRITCHYFDPIPPLLYYHILQIVHGGKLSHFLRLLLQSCSEVISSYKGYKMALYKSLRHARKIIVIHLSPVYLVY